MSAARFFDGIDWSCAWFSTVRPVATALLASADWRLALNQQAQQLGLRNHRGLPLQFIPQEDLPDGVAYEAHISASGGVPTRENLHDFFNALVWLRFPLIKRQLNALQAAQIAQLGIGKSRGPARDAATIFDENAALLVVADDARGDSLTQALRQHDWQQAFITQREAFGQFAEVWSFGHALMEKLVAPYKAITAHSWVVRVSPDFFAAEPDKKCRLLDSQVAAQLAQHSLTTADYTPLPVLGIPDWWPLQDLAFYQDTQVFRPARQARR
ncbi:DUF3025 domain-containing protein [Undibacterium sp. CY7W]|uniref:DUF3025 domain-containing protein n=1 Tax=Undibacterium rugosum TaxID=2762291 RepID=A0A923I9S2_9BURK|nr:DUF3025 domain-containing protein [Undibacterium rugosum]MBC3935250.1 DUF3025 domain-containing protein [Undibacterium rugosum]